MDSTAETGPGAIDGGPQPPLGTIARFVSAPDDQAQVQDRRSRLFKGLSASRFLYKAHQDGELAAAGVELPDFPSSKLGYERVCSCLWTRFATDGVHVTYSSERQRASYKGLVTCRSVWMCPVCNARISEFRRDELGRAVAVARDRGCVVVLATFTIPHAAGDDLGALVDQLNEAARAMRGGRPWRRLVDQFGIDGPTGRGNDGRRLYSVRSFECTYGYNGWHPHLHVLFMLAAGSDVPAFQDELRHFWYSTNGGQYQADPETGELLPVDRHFFEHGCIATSSNDRVADYVAKWGHDPRWDVQHELAKANSKRGRGGKSKHYTLADLLWSYIDTGNRRHGALWVEFGLAMKGRKQLVWAPGLREWAGLGVELTDDQVAEDASDYLVDLAVVDDLTWQVVRRQERRAELLAVADSGDRAQVHDWLWDVRRVRSSPGAPHRLLEAG